MWWLLWIINKHYQGRLRVRTNCFWTHKGGFNFRIAKASINLSIRPWRLLYNTTNADLMSTLWPVSTKCFAMEEDVCLSCDLIWPLEFIWFCSHLGMCSATLICKSRLLLPMYVCSAHTCKLVYTMGCDTIAYMLSRFLVEHRPCLFNDDKLSCIECPIYG